MSEKEFVTKDSGERRDFGTGSVRDRSEGKGRFDLIPPIMLRRVAGLYERGAVKYGTNNWQKGQPLSASYLDSAMRHLSQLVGGEPTEDHAAAVIWNMAGFMWTLAEIEAGRLPKSLDDRPPPEPQYVEKKAEETAPLSPTITFKSLTLTHKTFVPIHGTGYVAFVDAWKAGGCAWCGTAERGGGDYVHPACENLMRSTNVDMSKLVKTVLK